MAACHPLDEVLDVVDRELVDVGDALGEEREHVPVERAPDGVGASGRPRPASDVLAVEPRLARIVEAQPRRRGAPGSRPAVARSGLGLELGERGELDLDPGPGLGLGREPRAPAPRRAALDRNRRSPPPVDEPDAPGAASPHQAAPRW